jgi:Sec-independent protein translocase protein TatA
MPCFEWTNTDGTRKGRVMISKVALLLFGSLSLATYAADVFRWVDENGKIHYGDSVPERYKQAAKKLDAERANVTSAQRQEAEARLAREKAAAESMRRAREAKLGATQSSSAKSPDIARVDGNAGCAEQMKRYQESLDCFAPYRTARGGIKQEAFQHCTEVKQPAGCFLNPAPSDRTYDIPRGSR